MSDKHNKNYKHKDKIFHTSGLHHLHLGNRLPNGKIDKRRDENNPVCLLIILISKKDRVVHFLDIITHAEFDEFNYYRYVEILDKEDLINNNEYLIKLNSNEVGHKKLTPDEYRQITNNGIIASLGNINNSVIVPRVHESDCRVYARRIEDELQFCKYRYLNIMAIHDLVQRENLYHRVIKRYKFKIIWRDFLLNVPIPKISLEVN